MAPNLSLINEKTIKTTSTANSLTNASLTATATESIQFDGRALSLGSGTLPAPPNQTVPSDAAATHRSSPTFANSQSKIATTLTIPSPDPIQSGILNTTPTSTTNPTFSSTSSPPLHIHQQQQRQSAPSSPVTSSNQLDSDVVTSTVLSILNNNSLHSQSQNSQFQFGTGAGGGVSAASGISKTGNLRFEPVVNMPPPDSPHAEPAPRKRRRKREDPQSCFTNSEEYDSDDASPVSCSDVESFQGKIVYNPDGSAYIIDSENDSLSNISENGLGTVNDYFGLGVPATNNPKIHSFRVVTARDATVNITEPNSKISKPILMCFICKLSFGNTKSFSLHAANEHALNLQECEKMLLNREYSSAIIQRNGDEKPQISFLEPLDVQKQMQHTMDQQSLSKSNDLAVKTLSDYHQSLITAASTASTTQSTNVPPSATTVAGSTQISTENTNSTTGSTASNSKFLSELFLQQQLQQQRESTPLQCPDHQGMKGIDCKTCEMMNVSIKSPMTPIKSPNNLNMTPPGSSSVNMSPTTPAPSFTIGACPEHINGRPIGVECPRCELILNSARLNSGVQISTRNSCKTLKCPQCNWHYKYQETLEIHMREKHPDGESACGYCLAGQQHPRLARGESYTCGYKPYRCEICNYSTTTKGNLSIHMQSDKHLNNMQELNSTQNLSQASEIRESPKIILPNMSQQSAKPKPSFRCDVCSYETSVARNLRIHMTSEKHTHNMAVLQNNIKHLQALSFLQSQNIGQLPNINSMPNLPSLNQSIPNLSQNMPNLGQNLPNFLPEAALADLAYNQALMIQLLHQNSAASASGALGGSSNVSGGTGTSLTGGVSPVSASRANSLVTPNSNAMVESDHGLNPDSFEPPIEPDLRPTTLFSCLVCGCYNTNSIEELNNHLLIDRSRNYNTDIMIISNSNYHCSLCKYNTNLKANFQLHSKTDKHIQKLNYINHIKEGGIKNEYKLKYNGNNSVQLKCNCCDYYTNSIQKLNLHTQNMRHENAKIIFNHLVYTIQNECNKNSAGGAGANVSSGSLSSSSDQSETGAFDNGDTVGNLSDNNFNQKVLLCQLCNYKAPHTLAMVQHVKSLRHVQIEQIICLQRRSENLDSLELVDVFKIGECDDKNDKSSPQHSPVSKSLADQLSAVAAVQQHQQQLNAAAALSDQLGHSTAIFKCNQCNHFTETKTEIEHHLAIHHPNCAENDFFVIPTNPAQAAAAAAAMAYQMAQSTVNKQSSSIDDDIKSEKMDADDGSDCGGDLGETDCDAIDTTDEMCGILCPLCQKTFSDKKSLEKHVVTEHSVTSDGLTSLLNLVDANQWINNKKSPSIADCKSDGEIECTTCGTGFKAMMELLHHANDNQHYQMTSDNMYACVLRTCHANFPTISNMNAHFKDCHMNIVISERHVYKYRCKLCSLAFKTQDKLNTHSLYHSMRDATKCNVCNRNFRSTQSLQKHMDQAHNNSTSVSPITSPGLGGDKSDVDENMTSPSSIKQEDCDLMDGNRDEALGVGQIDNCHETNEIDEYLNSQPMAEECYNDQNRKFKCHKCKMGFTQQHYLGQHYKTNVHRRNEKGNYYPMEKYLDPNRPFKCEICRESFTQKNILLVHYNSVSHLHKLKKQSENNNTPSTSPSAVGDFDRKSIEYDRRSNDVDRKSVDLDRKSVDFDRKSVDGDSDSSKRKLSPENDYDSPKKRFKCDICKVAYAQGSTLDIHMRSVLHQVKAEAHLNAVEEDSNRTHMRSVQHPNRPNRLQEQQAQLLQQQLSPGMQRLPMDLNQSQTGSSVSPTPSNLSTTNHEVVENNSPKINNQIYKTLLENFGFDIVKQFNEINKNNNGNPNSNATSTDSSSQPQQQQKQTLQQQQQQQPLNAQNLQQQLSLQQQLNSSARSDNASEEKYFCRHCKKIFSSIFVLKTHCEEIHNEKIPLDFLEKFAEKFKSYYLDSAENENEILDFSSKKEIKEKVTDVSKVLPTTQQQQQQQQQLLQQAQQQLPASLAAVPELAQKLNIDPTVLAQKMMEQNFANLPPNFANLPQNLQSLQSLQGLQNIQNLQNLPNMGNLPMNTLEMLNLMQFHHLMSLNFMNLAPPLIFGGTGGSSSIPSSAGATGGAVTPNEISTTAPQQVQMLQQQAAAAQAAAVQQAAASNNQKRARTRITDEQLKILRAHFDINNSPSEESIKDMSFKANLPPKVVKHWFRNTLFKERQRNKDSPYNFNNPPSTTLNLEEYERTGQTKVTSLSNDSADLTSSLIAQQQQQQQQSQQAQQELQQHSHNIQQQTQQLLQVQQAQQAMLQQASQHLHQSDTRPHSHPSSIASNERPSDIQVKSEPGDENECGDSMKNEQMIDHDSSMHSHHTNMYYNNFETKSESGSSEILSRPPTPNSSYNNINEMINQQIESIPINNITNMGVGSIGNSMGPPKKFQMNMKLFDKSFESNSNSSNSSTSSGKRANRTRFTDYQIKVLQEFFENNSYPKDSDLEYLSKLLSLSPRVIVVWFQNARQKQRKIYENQPNNSYYESAEEKKPNINYTCKKCNLVFQRYYELIRHQKNHCFKEENNKKSAKAQIAAAQIAQSLSSEDSNSSIDINNASSLLSGNIAAGLQAQNLSLTSPNMLQSSHSAIPGLSTSPNLSMLSSSHSIFGKSAQAIGSSGGHQSPQSTSSQQSPTQKYECDKCNLMFSRYELYKEHQLIHLMNPNLFLQQSLNQQYSENTPFGILQNLSGNAAATASTSDTMDLSQKQKKRKFSETSQDNDHGDYEQLNKKLKNEQFEFLYNYFVQNEGADEIVKAKNIDFESLYTYYQTNELKKKGNFDFLYQYYVQNERPMDMSEKPSFEFLFQYYQINESKKFFQLEASPSKNDFLMMNLTSTPKNPTAPTPTSTALSKQQQATANSSSGMLTDVGSAVAATVGRQTPIAMSTSQQQSLSGSVGGGGLIIHNTNSNGSSTCGTTNPADLLIQSMHQGEITAADKQNNKRLRTTILPEQLNFLYECYQNESNPSRKMLEEISKKVNLKKRVVQVWYQNSRARERKGQFRQNLQIINKKCPHCGAIFKIKSALESHLQTKHPDKQPINIDQIPDVKPHVTDFPATSSQTNFKAMLNDQLIDNNNKLSVSDFAQLMDATASILAATTQQSSPFPVTTNNGVIPLDLSTTTPKYEPSESEISFSDSNNDHDESNDFCAQSNGNFGYIDSNVDGGDGLLIGKANNNNNAMNQMNGDLDCFGPCSPASSTQSQQKKRYRTQMSHRQVNILKVLFGDYKTPSMIDCENIGREIGLPKRVVQVWFQNARAKDKKSRNSRYTDEESVSGGMNTANPSPDLQPIIDDCKICGIQKVNMQEHVFSNAHIAQVKASLEGVEVPDQHDDGHNLTKPQQSPTPASSISSNSSIPSASNMLSQQSSTHDAMGLYNQFLLQNHMFGQLSGALNQNQSSDQHQELLALQHHLNQQQQAALNNSGSSTSTTNGSTSINSQQPTQQQLLMENNLLLQINADNQPTTNSEILQQLYSYSQMSAIGGK